MLVMLHFSCGSVRFAEKSAMRSEVFEYVCRRIQDYGHAGEVRQPFHIICLTSGISRRKADNLFYEEFGMSCEEVLEAFQNGNMNF